jgi:asparagine synthase (glutamine-hydrolysing)
MCGIAGIFDPYGRYSTSKREEIVARMSDAIVHRGPDGSGLESFGPTTLGHRRLAIIDLTEAGYQPMLSGCGRWAISYNGELYNS